jgi:hypothetical protein
VVRILCDNVWQREPKKKAARELAAATNTDAAKSPTPLAVNLFGPLH